MKAQNYSTIFLKHIRQDRTNMQLTITPKSNMHGEAGLSNPDVAQQRGLIAPSLEEGLLVGRSRSSILKVIIYHDDCLKIIGNWKLEIN
jgi:hypothetical protein